MVLPLILETAAQAAVVVVQPMLQAALELGLAGPQHNRDNQPQQTEHRLAVTGLDFREAMEKILQVTAVVVAAQVVQEQLIVLIQITPDTARVAADTVVQEDQQQLPD